MKKNVIRKILTECKTIAVVGLSRDSNKDSYRVAKYLKEHGFRIVPVNPYAKKVLGEKSYKSLLDIPAEIQKDIDVVNVFRPSVDVPTIVEQTIKLKKTHAKPLVVWTQLGIMNEEAASNAKDSGLTFVMDKCMMIEHNRLFHTEDT